MTRYLAQVEGTAYDVEVEPLAAGRVAVAIGEHRCTWRASDLGGQTWLLHDEADGQVHAVGLCPQPGRAGSMAGQLASCGGQLAHVQVLDLRQAHSRRAAQARPDGGPQQVCSPMPGRVVAILVAAGDEVVAGQALMVVEAMKMENEVLAGRAGRVAEVHVDVGDCPEGGARLCTLL